MILVSVQNLNSFYYAFSKQFRRKLASLDNEEIAAAMLRMAQPAFFRRAMTFPSRRNRCQGNRRKFSGT